MNNDNYEYPKAYLYHFDGGHIHRSNVFPSLKKEGKPSAFTIIPLDQDGKAIECSSRINTRAEYIHSLMSWDKVAIQGEKGCFIDCGKKLITNTAQTYYGTDIGKSEQFELEHCSTSGTFSFKSYNGLYLDYSTFNTGKITCNKKQEKQTSWHVYPLGLSASDSEKILFVGVVNKDKKFLIERTAEGVAHEWRVNLDSILRDLINGLSFNSNGSSILFQHEKTHHKWCVTRSSENALNIVVSSEGYPAFLATECVEELEHVFDMFNDQDKDERLKSANVNKEEHYEELLSALIYEYDDQYACSVFAAHNEKVRETLETMTENIAKMQENILTAEELEEKTNELLEFASTFKKQSSELKYSMWKKTAIFSGVVIGGTSGAVAGFLLGGPGGAVLLASETVEVVVGTGLGVFLGGTAARSCTSLHFWKRKFTRIESLSKRSMTC